MSLRLLALAALSAVALPSQAAIAIGGPVLNYTQTFDTLATAGTANPWLNDTTLTGWSLFTAAGTSLTSYRADSGTSNAGAFYSYGTGTASERALGALGTGAYFGSPASGALAGYMAVAFTNAGDSALSSFTLSFDGEQWRNGGNTSNHTMVLEYGFGATFADVTWSAPGGNFDWTSQVANLSGTTSAAVDGNTAGLLANRGGTVSNLNWAAGETLWIRWVERNDTGNDHGLAIDNVSLSVTSAVPEPSSYALLLAGLGVVGMLARRRGSFARQA